MPVREHRLSHLLWIPVQAAKGCFRLKLVAISLSHFVSQPFLGPLPPQILHSSPRSAEFFLALGVSNTLQSLLPQDSVPVCLPHALSVSTSLSSRNPTSGLPCLLSLLAIGAHSTPVASHILYPPFSREEPKTYSSPACSPQLQVHPLSVSPDPHSWDSVSVQPPLFSSAGPNWDLATFQMQLGGLIALTPVNSFSDSTPYHTPTETASGDYAFARGWCHEIPWLC